MLCGKADKQKKRGVLRCTQKEGRVNQNELIEEQEDIFREIYAIGYNIIICANCGSIILRRVINNPEDITCHNCMLRVNTNDCTDLWDVAGDRDISLFFRLFRNIFMELFRDDCALNGMSTDDRLEVFCSILQGAGDITAELLNEILDNYGVENLKVIEIGDES